MLSTPSAIKWIKQFSDHDRQFAEATLDKLELISEERLKNDLESVLSETVDRYIRNGTTIIMESTFSKEDTTRFLSSESNYRPQYTFFRNQKFQESKNFRQSIAPQFLNSEAAELITNPHQDKLDVTRCMYKEYDPSKIRDFESGSEKLIDLIVRSEFDTSHRKQSLIENNSQILRGMDQVQNLEQSQSNIRMILVADNIGSGKQIIDFLEDILLSSSIGPLSGNELNITIITWTATTSGLAAINEWADEHPRISMPTTANATSDNQIELDIIHLHSSRTFFDLENSEARENLFDFFDRHKSRKHPEYDGLGFGGVASTTILTGSSCPNNVPDLLIQDTDVDSYAPIFANKNVPPDIKALTRLKASRADHNSDINHEFWRKIRSENLVQATRRTVPGNDLAWKILVHSIAGYPKWQIFRDLSVSYHNFAATTTTGLMQSCW